MKQICFQDRECICGIIENGIFSLSDYNLIGKEWGTTSCSFLRLSLWARYQALFLGYTCTNMMTIRSLVLLTLPCLSSFSPKIQHFRQNGCFQFHGQGSFGQSRFHQTCAFTTCHRHQESFRFPCRFFPHQQALVSLNLALKKDGPITQKLNYDTHYLRMPLHRSLTPSKWWVVLEHFKKWSSFTGF